MKIIIQFFITATFLTAGPIMAYVPNEAISFEHNIKMINVGRSSEDKILKALDLVKSVLASEEFRKRILEHKYNGWRVFVDNKGLYNYQIYNSIIEGAETLHPYKNNTMDLEVQLYSDYESNTIGYTWPLSPRIWLNTKYFNKRDPAQIAGTLVHEWLHKLGFGHEWFFTPERNYSVPYAIGNLVEEIAGKIEKENSTSYYTY